MTQEGSESIWKPINYGRFVNQFRSDIISSIRQHEMINAKICRQNISILFNQKCLNEEMLPKYTLSLSLSLTHTHTHRQTLRETDSQPDRQTHIYIYIYIYISYSGGIDLGIVHSCMYP